MNKKNHETCRIIKKHSFCKQNLHTLNITLEEIKKFKAIKPIEGVSQQNILEALRDSAIQRFEYSIDTVWKYLKEYLLHKRGVAQTHPKPVFRECFKANLLNEEESLAAIKMVDARNITSHAHNKHIAKKVFDHIPQYLKLMEKLIDIAKPE